MSVDDLMKMGKRPLGEADSSGDEGRKFSSWQQVEGLMHGLGGFRAAGFSKCDVDFIRARTLKSGGPFHRGWLTAPYLPHR